MPTDPKQKPAGRTPSKLVRIPVDMADRVDAVRGLIPRETFIRDLLDKALRTLEEQSGR
ncbi:hypothetical protein [Conexibacter sp. SYSU D00693]|uniref:hypothetical protein n=1 Tax=Conexibacter sp. SYSU D00693 TaxID=2812560 RepID=UPI00196B1F58|nr:hypothetical protein [Conexibacter sp. SYSU D00693]